MRKKEDKPSTLGVADGLDFSNPNIEPFVANAATSQYKAEVEAPKSIVAAEVDPNRVYSPYYTPKPKLGTRGGTLGRGSVDESERKVQFSLTCTPAQKEAFIAAAKKDKRKLPEFICLAIEEYIENHNL